MKFKLRDLLNSLGWTFFIGGMGGVMIFQTAWYIPFMITSSVIIGGFFNLIVSAHEEGAIP